MVVLCIGGDCNQTPGLSVFATLLPLVSLNHPIPSFVGINGNGTQTQYFDRFIFIDTLPEHLLNTLNIFLFRSVNEHWS
jgi:hypothetical protein